MGREKYVTVKIPSELADILDQIAGEMGYRSRAEIVDDAIRRFIDAHKSSEQSIHKFGKHRQEEQLPVPTV